VRRISRDNPSMKLRVILLASVIASFTLMAGTPQTTITVSVRNQFDKPVENADVILDFRGSHDLIKLGRRKPTHWEVHTNMEGIAHFPPIPQGTIQLQVITKKYQTFGNKFDLDTEAKTIDVKLNAPQQQYSAHPPLKPADTPKQ
jgi:hypothetical protein